MAASINDKITDSFNSANPNVAKVTAGRTAGATTLVCDNLAGWPTVSAVHFSTYQIDTNNALIAGTQIDWKGVVSGNSIGSLTREAGATDAGNSIGDVVEMNVTGAWWHDIYTGLTQEHNQLDGTHKAITTTGYSQASGTFTVPSGVIQPAALATGITYSKLLSTIFSGQVSSQTNAGTAGGTMYYVNLGGIKFLFGSSGTLTVGSIGSSFTWTLPNLFFTTIQTAVPVSGDVTGHAEQYTSVISKNTTTITTNSTSPNGAGTTSVNLIVIGT